MKSVLTTIKLYGCFAQYGSCVGRVFRVSVLLHMPSVFWVHDYFLFCIHSPMSCGPYARLLLSRVSLCGTDDVQPLSPGGVSDSGRAGREAAAAPSIIAPTGKGPQSSQATYRLRPRTNAAVRHDSPITETGCGSRLLETFSCLADAKSCTYCNSSHIPEPP